MVDKLVLILTCMLFSMNGNSQIVKKINDLSKNDTFCKGAVVPYGILPPSVKRSPKVKLFFDIPIKNRINIFFYTCIDSTGKAGEIVLLGARLYNMGSKSELIVLKELDSFSVDSLLDIKVFLDYINQIDFSPANNLSRSFNCKMFIIFEARETKKSIRSGSDIYRKHFRLLW